MLLSIKQAAKKRGYPFKLTKGEVREIQSRPCFYCGVPPKNRSKNNHSNGDYVYSSLDRIDNTKGYITDNVVACCQDCNFAKASMIIAAFYAWIEKVSSRKAIVLNSLGMF